MYNKRWLQVWRRLVGSPFECIPLMIPKARGRSRISRRRMAIGFLASHQSGQPEFCSYLFLALCFVERLNFPPDFGCSLRLLARGTVAPYWGANALGASTELA